MFKNKKGFTLIEFIIVMAIIGILVLLAAPKFMDYIRDAKLTQIKNDTRVVEDVLLTEQTKLLTEDKDIDKYLIKDKTQDKGISSDSEDLVNNNTEGVQIDPEFIKEHTNTKLDPEEFYFDKEDNKVFYHYNKAKDKNKDKDNNNETPNKTDDPEIEISDEQQKALEKYKISKSGNEITVNGFNPDYSGDKNNIDDIIDLELNGDKIIKIADNAFKESNFKGQFPKLDNLQEIGIDAFEASNFTENFPLLKNINTIGSNAFKNSNFTGKFPELKNIHFINANAFKNSKFDGEFPELYYIRNIGNHAFEKSTFSGELKALNNLQFIGVSSFKNSQFEGSFPQMNSIERIGAEAFYNSNFKGEFPKLEHLTYMGQKAFWGSHNLSFEYYDNMNSQEEWKKQN